MSPPRIEEVEAGLRAAPRTFLVTGAAGFIGSHLMAKLLALGQRVRGLDNFATGHRRNLDEVLAEAGPEAASRFQFVEGDIRDLSVCRRACEGVDVVLHHAALGSVPRSLADPLLTHSVNVDGFVNMLVAARDAAVKRFVFASSSSVYGDDAALPKAEARIGRPLSPYAATKQADEVYAAAFRRAFALPVVGLRYFNVFGERQDPNGPYSAVIPRWTHALAHGGAVEIHGDGKTSRDFCYVQDVVQANLLAATLEPAPASDVFNIAYGETTSLESLFRLIRDRVAARVPAVASAEPRYGPFRAGDIRHSQAEIARARDELGYASKSGLAAGLDRTVRWFLDRAQKPN